MTTDSADTDQVSPCTTSRRPILTTTDKRSSITITDVGESNASSAGVTNKYVSPNKNTTASEPASCDQGKEKTTGKNNNASKTGTVSKTELPASLPEGRVKKTVAGKVNATATASDRPKTDVATTAVAEISRNNTADAATAATTAAAPHKSNQSFLSASASMKTTSTATATATSTSTSTSTATATATSTATLLQANYVPFPFASSAATAASRQALQRTLLPQQVAAISAGVSIQRPNQFPGLFYPPSTATAQQHGGWLPHTIPSPRKKRVPFRLGKKRNAESHCNEKSTKKGKKTGDGDEVARGGTDDPQTQAPTAGSSGSSNRDCIKKALLIKIWKRDDVPLEVKETLSHVWQEKHKLQKKVDQLSTRLEKERGRVKSVSEKLNKEVRDLKKEVEGLKKQLKAVSVPGMKSQTTSESTQAEYTKHIPYEIYRPRRAVVDR